jgi:hypothetical protein
MKNRLLNERNRQMREDYVRLKKEGFSNGKAIDIIHQKHAPDESLSWETVKQIVTLNGVYGGKKK